MTMKLAPLAVLLLAPTAHDVVYAPAAGTKLTRTFHTEMAGSMEVRVEIDGADHPTGSPAYGVSAGETVRVVDELGAVVGGAPSRVRRTFEEITLWDEYEHGGETVRLELVSPFEDETVTFVRDTETGEVTVELPEDSSLDHALTEHLDEDMDLRGFLPDGKVEVGGTWDVDPEAYAALRWPSGLLQGRPEDADARPEDWLATDLELRETLDGEITATLVRVDEDVAEIALRVKVTASAGVDVPPDGESPVSGAVRTTSHEREGEGVLRWDLGAGHALDLELTLEAVHEIREESTFQMPGGTAEVLQIRTFEGELVHRVTIE